MFARTSFTASLLSAIALSVTPMAFAGSNERPSVDQDFPLRMEDARPVDYQSGYVKLIGRYAHEADATDLTLIQPEIAYGFAPNFDVHLFTNVLVGDGDRGGSGDLTLNGQWLFHDENPGDPWPALAIEADVIFPTGVGSDGIDVGGQLSLTKTLVRAPTWDSLHLNLTYTHNFIPAADERQEAYNAILGYSRQIMSETTFLTDVVWERTADEHVATYIAEIGLIQEIGEHVRVAGGIGVGLGDDSPDFTATIGIIVEN